MSTQIVYLTVKVEIAENYNTDEVIENCDYDFTHDAILRTEIVEISDKM
jgi:hypothetical protein